MQRIKKIIPNIIILLIVIILFVTVFEIILRLKYVKITQEGCTVASNELIWKLKPNCNNITNSKGYRDYEYEMIKPNNTFRIILIGDSIVHGLGVGLNESFGKILEKKLNNHSKKYEVIQLSCPGYTTSQELILLKKAYDYNPDLIIWSYSMNDPLNPIYHSINYELRTGYTTKWYDTSILSLAFVKEKIFFLKERIKGINCNKEYHHYIHCVYWKEIEKNIQEIKKSKEKNGIDIIFLLQPIYEGTGYSNYPLEDLHEKITGLLQKNNLTVYDALNAFKEKNPKELGLMRNGSLDIWHPGPLGHQIIANFLYQSLVNKNHVQE